MGPPALLPHAERHVTSWHVCFSLHYNQMQAAAFLGMGSRCVAAAAAAVPALLISPPGVPL